MIAVFVIQGAAALLTVFYLWLSNRPDTAEGPTLRRSLPFIWLFQLLAVQLDAYLGHRQVLWLAETLWATAWVLITAYFAVRSRGSSRLHLLLC